MNSRHHKVLEIKPYWYKPTSSEFISKLSLVTRREGAFRCVHNCGFVYSDRQERKTLTYLQDLRSKEHTEPEKCFICTILWDILPLALPRSRLHCVPLSWCPLCPQPPGCLLITLSSSGPSLGSLFSRSHTFFEDGLSLTLFLSF